MYIRFAQYERDPMIRSPCGLFRADLPRFDPSDWRHQEIRRCWNWFNRHLSCPDRLSMPVGKKARRQGVCWFRDAAANQVSEARYLAWLLNDIGVPIRELRSPRPGTVIWSDDAQIVAVSEPGALVTVH